MSKENDTNRRHAILKRLVAILKCGLCGRKYDSTNVNILGHQDDLWFLSVFCSSCRTQGLIAAVIREGVVAEVVSELTEEEVAKFAQAEVVAPDDVLDIHNLLKDFKGGISELLSKG